MQGRGYLRGRQTTLVSESHTRRPCAQRIIATIRLPTLLATRSTNVLA